MDESLLDNEKEWRRYLVTRIDRLENEVVNLRIKSSLWGGIAGLLAAIGVVLLSKLKG